MLIRTFLN